MIRKATLNDRDNCYDLAKEVYGEFMARHGIEINEIDLYKTVDFFITNGQNLVIEQDGKVCAMTAWLITGHPANSQLKIFSEVLWCCKSKYKTDALILLRGLEAQAKLSGASIIILANLSLENEPRLRKIYGRMGYVYMESHYQRGI